ncbi:hypothetical protein [Streptomyces sp. NPDC060198]|uniref:hypothetical protein n=1 Tax=Streptomyces sp. NPDC060198 TaxID=3347070 RepID=UPI003648E598
MSNDPTPTIADQGGPIGLLAYLHTAMPHLPAATVGVDRGATTTLEVRVYDGLANFNVWLTALGLGYPTPGQHGTTAWLTTSGKVANVEVELTAYASADEVDAYMQPLPTAPAEVSAALTAMATATASATVQQQGGAA